jgi:hypothetical protein
MVVVLDSPSTTATTVVDILDPKRRTQQQLWTKAASRPSLFIDVDKINAETSEFGPTSGRGGERRCSIFSVCTIV